MDTTFLENQIDITDKKNPIVSCMMYNLKSLDDSERKFIKIVEAVQNLLNIKYNRDFDLKYIAITIIYIYNSYNILWDLPHMLDRIQRKGLPCSYLVFGELVVQLSSISFFSEAIKLINQMEGINLSEEIRHKVQKINFNILTSINIKVDKNIFKLSDKSAIKKILRDDLENKKSELYKCAIDLALNVYSEFIPEKKRKSIIYKIRKYLIDNILN